jgi:hypothetical protein
MQTRQSAETLQGRGPTPPPHNGEGTRASLCICAKALLEFQPHILQNAVGQTGADLGQVPPASTPQPLPHPSQSAAVQKVTGITAERLPPLAAVGKLGLWKLCNLSLGRMTTMFTPGCQSIYLFPLLPQEDLQSPSSLVDFLLCTVLQSSQGVEMREGPLICSASSCVGWHVPCCPASLLLGRLV